MMEVQKYNENRIISVEWFLKLYVANKTTDLLFLKCNKIKSVTSKLSVPRISFEEVSRLLGTCKGFRTRPICPAKII